MIQRVERDELPNYGLQIVNGRIISTSQDQNELVQPEVQTEAVSDNLEPEIPKERTTKKVE